MEYKEITLTVLVLSLTKITHGRSALVHNPAQTKKPALKAENSSSADVYALENVL
jgi:hypothetical protein